MSLIGRAGRSSRTSARRSGTTAAEPSRDPAEAEPPSAAKRQFIPCDAIIGTHTMDLKDAGCRARFLIRDRDGKFPELFNAVLADAGIEVLLTGVRMPRMNAIAERWVQTC